MQDDNKTDNHPAWPKNCDKTTPSLAPLLCQRGRHRRHRSLPESIPQGNPLNRISPAKRELRTRTPNRQ
ncbi:MAG: hypothetical protein Q9224_005240 [Gallowayella concinna]